jgi:hypothetical protein
MRSNEESKRSERLHVSEIVNDVETYEMIDVLLKERINIEAFPSHGNERRVDEDVGLLHVVHKKWAKCRLHL